MVDKTPSGKKKAGAGKPDADAKPLAVVGIGVGMASLRSLETLFAKLNPDLDAAYVIAVRQQEGLTVQRVIQAISAQARAPIKIAAEREKLERGHIYVGGPDDIAGAVLTFLDVTSTVKAEAALRESEGRLRILLAELQHRVRNTLALVGSITRRTANSSTSVSEMTDHLMGRIEAFARVQAAVTRHPDRGVDLTSLIADEMVVHAVHEGPQLSIDGPTVALQPKAAESISLALHELATNAVKHGPIGSNSGRIAINWRMVGTDRNRCMRFEWAEHGYDGELAAPKIQGFGTELLTRLLPYELDAKTKLEFRAEGLLFSMEVPERHLTAV